MLIILTCTAFPLFSQEKAQEKLQTQNLENSCTDTKPVCFNFWSPVQVLSVTAGARLDACAYFKIFSGAAQLFAQLDMREFFLKTGFDVNDKNFRYTLQVIYAPSLGDHFNLGIKFINHFNRSYSTYFDFDFLTGIFFSYDSLKMFRFKADWLYFLKSSQIDVLKTSCPWIKSNSMAFSFKFDFLPLEWLDVYFEISSYNFFKYNLFLTFNTRLGFEFNFYKNMTLNLIFDVVYVDFFTLSANFSSSSAILSFTYKFSEIKNEK
ncbi:MAG: hypothetical protein ACTTHG_01730 [Treponemataceae bacterium]